MIKVCHMSSAHPQRDPRIFYKQCSSLAKGGYDTYFVSVGDSFVQNGVKFVGVTAENNSRLSRMIKTAKAVYKKALELDCDIYELHDPELLPYAKKLAKKGKKVIFDSHEDYTLLMEEKYYIPKVFRTMAGKILSKYQDHILSRIDCVIFPTYKNGKDIFEGKCKRSIVIENFPLLSELYDKYDESISKELNAICHIGSLSYERGIEHLIKGCSLANATLILGGSYSPKEFGDKLKMQDEYACVDYRGFCNREEVVKIYSQSLVGVATLLNVGQYNVFDNFATKVYEYMSMGLAVIMTDYEYVRKINDKLNFAILVEPDNPEEISKAIRELLNNPEKARNMGKNGRMLVKQEFNWNIEEQKLLKLYEELSQ